MIDLNALAFVVHCDYKTPQAQPNKDFVLNEAIRLASKLETDDIGFIYDPNDEQLCVIAGQFVGKIANIQLPYRMNLPVAVRKTVDIMLSVDEDYSKLVYIITDSYQEQEAACLEQDFQRAAKFIKVYGIGKNYDRQSLEGLCSNFGIEFVHFGNATNFAT